MSRYHVDNRFAGTQQNITTTYKSVAAIRATSPTPRRGRVVALAVGADGAPNATDCQIVYTMERVTVDGTGTAATPNPLFPADTASAMTSQVNTTVEGTYTLPVWSRALNQRASMQWVAQDNDAMILWPATAAGATTGNGLVGLALSPTYAAATFFGIDYEDL